MADDRTELGQDYEGSGVYRPSSKLGRYVLLRPLGEGGMGEIWLATDEVGSRVVLKIMPVGLYTSREKIDRFMREGRILTALRHSNICRIYEINQAPNALYIAMEYVKGVPLDRLIHFVNDPTVLGAMPGPGKNVDITTIVETITRTRYRKAASSPGQDPEPTTTQARHLPLQQALSIIYETCQAVRFAHEHGVLHRDIKPSNIVIRPDGKPVLLDFGIAKHTGGVEATLTQTGKVFGTIAYMAPEQALSARDVDERADVYGLGAVMYQLVTGKRHFVSSGDLVRDIKRLRDYEPIAPRMHSREIHPDLEAIMLKALEADHSRRYRNAQQLAEDIRRYQSEEPVRARRATLMYVLARKLRKHRRVAFYGAVLGLLALGFGAFYGVNYYRTWGKWQLVKTWNLAGGRARTHDLLFVDRAQVETMSAWECDSLGMRMRRDETCWLRDVAVAGDVRVVLDLVYDAAPDGFEVIINGARDSLPGHGVVPRGYSGQCGGYFGSLAFVSVNEKPGVSRLTGFAHHGVEAGQTLRLMIDRRGETVTLRIDGKPVAQARHLVPFEGQEFSRIGFRCYTTDMHVKALAVYRYALPRRVSPLVGGDALLAAGYAREAVGAYLLVADDHDESELGARALVRAFAAAQYLDSVSRVQLRDSVVALFAAGHHDSPLGRLLREEELVDMWERGMYQAVLKRLPGHCAEFPRTSIGQRLTASAPDSVMARLLPFMPRLGRIMSLDLDSLGLTDLEQLRGCDLLQLSCSRNPRIADLSPLSGMRGLMWLKCVDNAVQDLSPLRNRPLFSLAIDGNGVRDLSPLRGTPLRMLSVSGNFIGDLSPLAGAQLTSLDITDNRCGDLSPLRGMPLTRLSATASGVKDLGPLAGMSLVDLTCGTGTIESLEPLRGMPLQRVTLYYNKISDLSPLAGMPIRDLNIAANPVSDLRPLRGCPLRSLHITNTKVEDLEPLRGMQMRNLAMIRCPVSSIEPIADIPLTGLNCRETRIERLPVFTAGALRSIDVSGTLVESLEPLRGLRLESLGCSKCPVRSLSGIGGMPVERLDISGLGEGMERFDISLVNGMPLRYLDCSGVPVHTLAALAGAPLQEVYCQDARVTSLEPLVSAPPRVFHFYSEYLPVKELRRVDSLWSADTATRRLGLQARLYRWIRQGETDSLRTLATAYGGHEYLCVPIHWSRDRSRDLARRAGGRLAVTESDDEVTFMSGLISAGGIRLDIAREGREWRIAGGGLVDREQRWFRLGKKVDYNAKETTMLAIDSRGLVIPAAPDGPMAFVIEWE